MKPVTIFTTTLVVPDEDLDSAIKAYGLPEISKVKIPAVPEVPFQAAIGGLSSEIPFQAAIPEVLYTEEEYNELMRTALKDFKIQQENTNALKLVDFIAKEKDAEVRTELIQKVNEAISVTLQTTSI